jgi:hypothetical protein
MTGKVTTLAKVTNASTAYTLTLTDEQKSKTATIDAGATQTVDWNIPWYNGDNKWKNRFIEVYLSDGGNGNGSAVTAAIWQHGAGGDILYQQGVAEPTNPSTGTALTGVQEGANFDLTVNVVIPATVGGSYSVSLAGSPD